MDAAWMERLAEVDDDYLIGISNKGIVKRAYKDKEAAEAEIVSVGEEAQVKVGEETVAVRFPLGESKCTCPSRSICRHVVHAILILREACLKGGEDRSEQGTAAESPAEAGRAEGARDEGNALQKTGGSPEDCPVQETTGSPESAGAQEPNPEPNDRVKGSQDSTVRKEINGFPFEKLKKTLGNRYFQTFVNQVAADIRPGIQYASVVTVQLAEPGMVVKLLSPLEYSTCTCHKKELCRHKAAAILWCQLEAGVLKKEDLLKQAEDAPAYDMDQVKEAAGQMQAFLEELLGTGLSRVSPDVLDYLERLAIISHDALLARFEGYFRALADSYDRYLKRKAAFQTKDLMEQLARLYRRVEGLLQAQDTAQVAALAGEFRADYLPVGNLDLTSIAAERFQSQTGYEGETIYFLEENTKEWYTYTNAKPVFYDTARRRGSGKKEAALQGPAPWGLGISLENLLKVRIHLTGAKCDARNRLSSSQETKGEITGERGLCAYDIKGWYYRDFGTLFREQIGKRQGEGFPGQRESARSTELVFVQPDSCAKAEFSQTGQQLTLPLYDKAGHELLVEVTYSKEEAGTIRYLERISEKKLPCFLGKVTLRDGRLRMYPVDLLDIEETETMEDVGLDNPGRQNGPADKEAKDNAGEPGNQGMKGCGPYPDAARSNAGAPGSPAGKEAADDGNDADSRKTETEVSSGRRTKYEVLEDIAREILLLMEDLCQSGFDTVHDSTWKDLRKAARLTEQFGMKYLSELLGGLAAEAEAGRHRMERRIGPMAGLYARVIEYLHFAAQKAAYDRGADYYT